MTFIIFTFVICVISIKISDFYQSNAFFSNRIEQTLDGDKSSRDDIYNNVWTFFLNQHNLLTIIFGNGAYSSAKYIGVHAHNDWLEILISLGIFGVFLYLKYWFSLLKILLISKLKIIDRGIWIGFMSIIIINFMKTLFSMSIDDMLIYSSAMFGFCLSQSNNWNIK